MEKETDIFQEVRAWIDRDKEEALRRFRSVGLGGALRPKRRRARLPVLAGYAAVLATTAGLVILGLAGISISGPSRSPSLSAFLADSPLYRNPAPAVSGPPAGKNGASSASPLFTRLAAFALRPRDLPAAVEDATAAAPQVSPAQVLQKMETVIREKTLERLVARFYQISKEV